MVLVARGTVWRRNAGRTRLTAAGVAAVALTVRLTVSLRGGGLFGVHAYDDGVYFAAASALMAGRLPYRDFLFLHPPGVALALAPFAGMGWLTHDALGLAAARVAWTCIGATNALLASKLGRQCRHRGQDVWRAHAHLARRPPGGAAVDEGQTYRTSASTPR